jgi:hypothetical protein
VQNAKDLEELEHLRDLRADVERNDKLTAEIIRSQSEKIVDLDRKYVEECTLRKRYFNQMEDIKGKIRVYCRTRPLTKVRTDRERERIERRNR